jgi:diacylglycerol kinase (ATP)
MMPGTQLKVLHGDDERSFNESAPPLPPPSRRLPALDREPGASSGPRRCAWRQRLVDAECGLRLSLRMDGTMFVHLFVSCCVLAAGFVLGLSIQQWSVVAMAITLVITTETFHQMLRALWSGVGHHLPAAMRDVLRIGSAAVLLAAVGSGAAIILVFVERFRSG